MITVRCPNCGETHQIDENVDSFKCKYCRKTYLVSEVYDKTPSSELQSRINEAISKRNSCDFDDAQLILEDLLTNNPKKAEIYYQLLLTDYGISYVNEDNKIVEKPVLSRLQRESIFDKKYYLKICELLADHPTKLEHINERLKAIEDIRIKAMKLMETIEPYDAFICYKRSVKNEKGEEFLTKDSETARRLYDKLTKWGLKVFFAQETLHKQYAGQDYEPVIYSALMSSKIFLLVCASPEHQEYLLAPWVKNEWLRFKKRVENEVDNKLLLLPVFDNGFRPEQLPGAIMKGNYQGMPLNDEFDNNLIPQINRVIAREKKSKFQEIIVETKVATISTAKEEITVRAFSGFKEKELSSLEKTDFNMAIADMKFKSDKKFQNAYSKLCLLTQSNPYNYEANVAKIKCDLKIPFEESMVNYSIWRAKDINLLKEDYLAAMEVAGEEGDNLRNAFTKVLARSLEAKPDQFSKILDQEDNIFSLVLSTIQNKDDMFPFAKSFEDEFSRVIQHFEERKISEDNIINIANKIFRRIYSNFGENGAIEIINLYTETAKTLAIKIATKRAQALADKFYSMVLEINPSDVDVLWMRLNYCLSGFFPSDIKNAILGIVINLKEKNYQKFDFNSQLPPYAGNESNLYYFMIAAIQSGYKMRFGEEKTNNYFNAILFAAFRMTNMHAKRDLAKQIYTSMAGLSGSGIKSQKTIMNLLMAIGNRLLIEEDYDEARKYYEEVLSIDENDLDARWGLTKCDIKCPTNYSVLFYKGSLNEVPAFRTLNAVYEESHSDQVNNYLPYYNAIENIKNDPDKGVKKKKMLAFKEREAILLADPLPFDDPIDSIINGLVNGTLLSESRMVAKNNRKFVGLDYYGRLNVKKLITTFILADLIVGVAVLFKPEMVLAILAPLFILLYIFKKAEKQDIRRKGFVFYKLLFTFFGLGAIGSPVAMFLMYNSNGKKIVRTFFTEESNVLAVFKELTLESRSNMVFVISVLAFFVSLLAILVPFIITTIRFIGNKSSAKKVNTAYRLLARITLLAFVVALDILVFNGLIWKRIMVTESADVVLYIFLSVLFAGIPQVVFNLGKGILIK